MRRRCVRHLPVVLFAWTSLASSACDGSGLAGWRDDVKVTAVGPPENRHVIHSYFNTTPESPDGRLVVYFTSATDEGHEGEIRILERSTGKEQVLARGVIVEDAHRVACQQWISGGERVVFHDFRNGRWVVAMVDIATLEERVLAEDRHLGWAQPTSDIVPVYGLHYESGGYTDLQLLNVKTGEIRTVVTATGVREAYSNWVSKEFGDKKISIYFPVLSPNLERVFFKIATPGGGHFRSPQASVRKGLICYDLRERRFLFLHENWAHPAWHPDSKRIIEAGNILVDSRTGKVEAIPELPRFPGSHPSISPDGSLFTTETGMRRDSEPGGALSEYGIVVGDVRGGDYVVVHRFDHSRGAASWRISHPHPVFSPDGKRVYFNVSSTKWTRLYVAERAR